VQDAETSIHLAHEAGLLVYATIMIGNPEETVEDIKATGSFLVSNNVDSVGICISTPYPGTRLWDWCLEKNLIPPKPVWDDFTLEKCGVCTNTDLTVKQVNRWKIVLIFYF
jgi:radical SAM superfamily enzyme YgiQ (UPF0313 family)